MRQIQKQERDIKNKIKEFQNLKRRIQNGNQTERISLKQIERNIELLKSEKKRIMNEIPANWVTEKKNFQNLLKSEKLARIKYRRNVDDAYQPIKDLLISAKSGPALQSTSTKIKSLIDIVQNSSIKDAKKSIKEVISIISKSAPSTNLITSKLRKASRSLRKTSKDRSKSLILINEAIKIFEMEVKWRTRAEKKWFKQLSEYELKIRNSIGIRLQERLPAAMARKIASCQAVHRDISLNF